MSTKPPLTRTFTVRCWGRGRLPKYRMERVGRVGMASCERNEMSWGTGGRSVRRAWKKWRKKNRQMDRAMKVDSSVNEGIGGGHDGGRAEQRNGEKAKKLMSFFQHWNE